jgi:hypothetical protein
MQIKCYSCHIPFAINRDEIHAALDEIAREGHSHYNAVCPRCRKSNKISKKQLRRFAPNWEPPSKKKPAAE